MLSVDAIVHWLARPFNARKPDVTDGRRHKAVEWSYCTRVLGTSPAIRGVSGYSQFAATKRTRASPSGDKGRQAAAAKAAGCIAHSGPRYDICIAGVERMIATQTPGHLGAAERGRKNAMRAICTED